jgi:transcriptional regulator with GAF, ATPase, and Fis domain
VSAVAPTSVAELPVIIASEIMQKLMAMVQRVARSNAAVLITGETGCGKELIARAIHEFSMRSSKPWVDINCAALPEHLVESELFGYEKGAFSGADSGKPGLFELADKGTLFLDEIGELEPKIQVKLLRVLDGIPYFRLGGSRKVSVDVRVVAATNQPLEEAVRSGKFRSDLYHRIGQFQLKVPPLRERPEDIAALAEYFMQQFDHGSVLTPAAVAALQNYPWPGNVRELRNVIMQIATLGNGKKVQPSDLPAEVCACAAAPDFGELEVKGLDGMERQLIIKALARTGGHQGKAAAELGISRRTLSRKLRQYRLEQDPQLPSGELGELSREQQYSYRATLNVPATIRTGRGKEFSVTALNVSCGGMGVLGIEEPFQCQGALQVRFQLPNGQPIEATARIVWADLGHRAGVQFLEIAPKIHHELQRWVKAKQQEEGWSAADNTE